VSFLLDTSSKRELILSIIKEWVTKPFEDEDLITLFGRINFSGISQDREHLASLRG